MQRSSKSMFGSEKYKQSNSIRTRSVSKKTTSLLRVKDVSHWAGWQKFHAGYPEYTVRLSGGRKGCGGGGNGKMHIPLHFWQTDCQIQPAFCASGNIQLNILKHAPPLNSVYHYSSMVLDNRWLETSIYHQEISANPFTLKHCHKNVQIHINNEMNFLEKLLCILGWTGIARKQFLLKSRAISHKSRLRPRNMLGLTLSLSLNGTFSEIKCVCVHIMSTYRFS